MHFCFGNFYSNCSCEFLLVAVSERLQSKVSLSKNKKVSQDQKKTMPCALETGFS